MEKYRIYLMDKYGNVLIESEPMTSDEIGEKFREGSDLFEGLTDHVVIYKVGEKK